MFYPENICKNPKQEKAELNKSNESQGKKESFNKALPSLPALKRPEALKFFLTHKVCFLFKFPATLSFETITTFFSALISYLNWLNQT